MPGVTESDRKLIGDLQALLDQLAGLRRGLYIRRPGCACDERGLCALHAEVHSQLVDAADSLARAICKAESEG